ncbi:MAG: hypothetical protein AAF492_30830, partial [Verrucomicrobiota bacterium]
MNRTLLLTLIGLMTGFHLVAESRAEDSSVRRLQAAARHYEKEGQLEEAIETYLKIIKADAKHSELLQPRVVELYVKTRQAEKALELARNVMKAMPDSKAYLAEIYTRLGGKAEALAILKK